MKGDHSFLNSRILLQLRTFGGLGVRADGGPVDKNGGSPF